MILREGMANFTPQEEEFIDLILGATFPWFNQMATLNFPALSHIFLSRIEETGEPKVNSPLFPIARSILERICIENNIKIRQVYRMAANLTFADPSKHGDPHRDHEDFPHKVMLIYLNTFSAGETYLVDADYNVIDKVIPSEGKFAVFDGGVLHAQGFCKPQERRIVLVATFDGDIE